MVVFRLSFSVPPCNKKPWEKA